MIYENHRCIAHNPVGHDKQFVSIQLDRQQKMFNSFKAAHVPVYVEISRRMPNKEINDG